MPPVVHPESARGFSAALVCYLFWGVVPVYWKWLADIDPVEVIAHRGLWSLVVLVVLVACQGGAPQLWAMLRQPRLCARHLLMSLLLTTNWLVYVAGVNSGHVTECSLGYFLVPLVNVAAGRFVLHEPMRRPQWAAVGLAAIGVGLMVVQYGEVPKYALALAVSWGAYSLLRKRSPMGAVTGLALETLLVAPLALGWLAWIGSQGAGVLFLGDVGQHLLLVSTGIVTVIPLLLFGYGAQRIRLSTLGLLQYIAPSVQLVLGVGLYGEAFPIGRALAFCCIWAGLVLYSVDSLRQYRRAARSFAAA